MPGQKRTETRHVAERKERYLVELQEIREEFKSHRRAPAGAGKARVDSAVGRGRVCSV